MESEHINERTFLEMGIRCFFSRKLCECNVKIKVEQNNCNKQVDPRFILWQINCTKIEQNICSMKLY